MYINNLKKIKAYATVSSVVKYGDNFSFHVIRQQEILV